MRVAVIGATGNVGTSLVEVLAGDDRVDSIVGIARRRPDWTPAKTEWVEANVLTSRPRRAARRRRRGGPSRLGDPRA
jgi:uncharacterized protein YbjT (DUF2867 family)